MPSLAGTRLDKYEMLEEVGHGGMSVVYRATDTVLRREVAVKVLHPHLADREESRLRLQREAIAVAKLRHENILEIYDYSGTNHAESYIVTEFIHGPTLREWIDERLEPRPAVAALLIHRVASALSHAHRTGVVHRDIKPENVMIRLEDGCVKLMDFGIAQLLDNQKLTLTGQLIGSPAYMAPELISGKPLDGRTDIFSLGVMLYQLSTGQLPFSGRNPHEVLNRIADGDYPAPSTICPLVDKDLEAIIAKALATNSDDRYQTVDALVTELELYLEEMGLDPEREALDSYFRDHDRFVEELDARVSATLMQQAERAARNGHGARAICLLGRVLELDPRHRDARALLARLRLRERRVQQLLIAAGAVGFLGVATAGVVLMPPEPQSTLSRAFETSNIDRMLEPAERDPSSASEFTSNENDDLASREADPRDDTKPPEFDERVPNPSRLRPPPADGNRPIRKRVPETIECRIRLSGIPKSSLGNIKLLVDDRMFAVESMTPSFELSGTRTHWLQVQSERYQGEVTLTPSRCESEVSLRVRPKPASVQFQGVMPNTVVRCARGCDVEGWVVHSKLGGLALGSSRGDAVTFELKTDGYKTQTVSKNLYPGPNTVLVQLEPVDR